WGLPVVLVVAVLDLGQRAVGALYSLRVRAELRGDGGEHVLAGVLAREDRAVVAADAVGDRVQRRAVVGPHGREQVVDDVARIGGKARGCVWALREPCRREGREQRPPVL